MADVRYRWAPGVRLGSRRGDAAVVETSRGPVRFSDMDAGQLAVLEALDEGAGEEDLVAARGPAAGMEGPAWVYLTIERLLRLGVVDRLVGSPPVAVVEIIGRGYRRSGRALPTSPCRLSRFAYLHALDDGLVLESPRALSRLRLTDARGPAVIGLLARPAVPGELEWPPGIDAAAGRALVTALHQEGFLEPAGGPGAAAGDEERALAEWEFHDLLFHARSREGRHRDPYGATYRFEGVRDPLPAVKAPPAGTPVPLPRADLDALRCHDRPFAAVVEDRRSLRRPGPEPLTVAQLGGLLHRAARVRGRCATEHEEVSSRPYPGGGADYELEIYPVVHRVAGLDAGLYHYDPLGHAVTLVAPPGVAVDRLAADAARKAPPLGGLGGELPDVVLAVTARIQRLTYKYQSIPYAVALKDLGVLYQTLYLTATAMDLAPCALGGGDSELFAWASGLSPFIEPQIGEFLVSSRHPGEARVAGGKGGAGTDP